MAQRKSVPTTKRHSPAIRRPKKSGKLTPEQLQELQRRVDLHQSYITRIQREIDKDRSAE